MLVPRYDMIVYTTQYSPYDYCIERRFLLYEYDYDVFATNFDFDFDFPISSPSSSILNAEYNKKKQQSSS